MNTGSALNMTFRWDTKIINSSANKCRKDRRTRTSAVAALIHLCVFLPALYVLSIPSFARASQQEQAREALGSLTTAGEVYLNDSQAASELTVFSGDRVRTGESGVATFVMSGKGTLKIPPQSQVLFSGKLQFTAELESGTVVLTSISGPRGLVLRIGNYVVLSSVRQESATSKIKRAQDGAFEVSCLDGSIGVLTLEGKSGQFLQSNQSLTVSAINGLMAFSPGTKAAGNFKPGWLVLGVAGAAAAAAVAKLGSGGGRQSISPSTP